MTLKRRGFYLALFFLCAPTTVVANIDEFRSGAPASSIYYVDGPLQQLYDYLQQDIESNGALVKSWLRVHQYRGSSPNKAMHEFAGILSTSLMHQLLQRRYGQPNQLANQGSFACILMTYLRY